MSDVEMLCARNWERRRHAEEYDASGEWDWSGAEYEDLEEDPMKEREAMKNRCRRKAARAAKCAGRVALVVSVALGLAGFDLLCPFFLLIAFLFYALKFELQQGGEGVWVKISV